jgi:hypothetical protein
MPEYYYFTNVNSGLVLDAQGQSKSEGAHIIQFPAHPESHPDNQLWSFTNAVLATGEATAIYNKNSGLVLDVEGGSTAAGAQIIQFKEHLTNPDNQLWTFEEIDFTNELAKPVSAYLITNKKSGMVLDVKGASNENSAPVIQWPAHPSTTTQTEFGPSTSVESPNTDNQLWILTPA